MKFLIDTNVFFAMEDARKEPFAYTTLCRFAGKGKPHDLVVYPDAIRRDIENDKDVRRKREMLARMEDYSSISEGLDLTDAVAEEKGLKVDNPNDRSDSEILFALMSDYADVVVTEDVGIHRRARKLDIHERVLYAAQAANFLERVEAKQKPVLPEIKEVCASRIDEGASIFDSLKRTYPKFQQWFRKCAREMRRAWICGDEKGPNAILICKEETAAVKMQNGKSLRARKFLKICTFKVAETFYGRKIGELFLKVAFGRATARGCDKIYITISDKLNEQEHLKSLCFDFGFIQRGIEDSSEDDVWVKNHPIAPPAQGPDSPFDYHKKYYPWFVAKPVRKFIIPIRPKYHRILFPEAQKQPRIEFGDGGSSEGNTIKCAYLSHASACPGRGDILLFYRSHDERKLTSIGIVERAVHLETTNSILKIASKRTVYRREEIEKMADGRQVLVILFRLACHLKEGVGYNAVRDAGVLMPLQTIREIDSEKFFKLARKGSFDGYFSAR